MNEYIKDSGLFFKEVSKGIKEDLNFVELVQLSLNLALGCERLLKGILYNINPTYILLEPDFKHSVQILYKDKVILDSLNSKDLASKPNSDVITFSNSLLRAQIVSNTVRNHKNILFEISNIRDIIAHCELSLLDETKTREILKRDFYTMLKAFSKEHGIKQNHFFGENHIKLSRISGQLQTDLAKKYELLIDQHRGKWASLKNTIGFVEEKSKLTEEIYFSGNKFKVECPSCSSTAILYYKPVKELMKFDDEVHDVTVGVQIKKLKCQYCKLEIVDPALLDIVLAKTDEKADENSDINE